MKKNFLLLLAMVASLIGCNNNESVVAPVDELREVEFTVVDEQDISSNDLFESATSSLKGIEGIDIEELGQAYNEAVGGLELAENKTMSLPLFYRVTTVNYQTLDEANQPVTVSALIIYPLLRKITKVMLINHGTHLGALLVPSNYTAPEEIVAASGALCILPDYIGIGASSSHPDLYLNADVHGRTSTDALFTLLSFANQRKLNLSKNFDTYVLGYSQGGSVSLATLKAIQQLPANQQAQLRLKKVICGDGPYDLRATFESYIADGQAGKTMGLGAVVPFVINSMFNSYPDEMAQYNYEDFFTPWALSTGIPQAIRNNTETVSDVRGDLQNHYVTDILNMTYIQNNPEAFDKLMELLDRQNLCTGWSPQYPLQFFHCNPDGTVSYQNFVNAYAGLNNSYVLTPDTISSSIMGGVSTREHVYGFVRMMANVLAGKYY